MIAPCPFREAEVLMDPVAVPMIGPIGLNSLSNGLSNGSTSIMSASGLVGESNTARSADSAMDAARPASARR